MGTVVDQLAFRQNQKTGIAYNPIDCFSAVLSACFRAPSDLDRLRDYLESGGSRNFYEFSVEDFSDGTIVMELKMLPNSET